MIGMKTADENTEHNRTISTIFDEYITVFVIEYDCIKM